MALPAPPALRQAWGDEIISEAIPWFEQIFKQIVKEKAVPRDEYRDVLSRSDILEHDVSGLKTGIHELRTEMSERFDRIDERFDHMNNNMNSLFIEMNNRIQERFIENERHIEIRLDLMNERMLVQTRWLISSIALFGTVLSILMAIGQFMP